MITKSSSWCSTRHGRIINRFLQTPTHRSLVRTLFRLMLICFSFSYSKHFLNFIDWCLLTQRCYSLMVFFCIASDDNTTIYTFASSGTDQQIKLWRLYSLRDYKEPKGSSRLLPDGVIVSMHVLRKCLCKHIHSVYFWSLQEHLCGNSTVFGSTTMNTECIMSIQAHGSSVTCIKWVKPHHRQFLWIY